MAESLAALMEKAERAIPRGRVHKAQAPNKPDDWLARLAGGNFGSGEKRPIEWTSNYDQLVRLFRGSMAIAAGAVGRAMACRERTVKRRIVKKSGLVWEDVSYNHLLYDVLNKPNEYDTPYDLFCKNVLWYLMCGDSYNLKEYNFMDKPKGLIPLSPQWVKPIPGKDSHIAGYRIDARYYGTDQWDIPRKEIVRFQSVNIDATGNQRFFGFPLALAAENTIELEREMFLRLRHKFNNWAQPGMVFTTDERLGPVQLEQVVNEIWSQHRMVEHTGKPMVTHSGYKLAAGGDKAAVQEMDYRGSLEATLKFTSAVFGVPLAVVGLTADVNRASAEAAMYTFAINTINPLCVQMSERFTMDLAWDYEPDIFIWIAPLETNSQQEVVRSAEACWRAGAITPNEVRDKLMNLGPLKDGGDVPILPAGSLIANYGNDENQVGFGGMMANAGVDTNGLFAQSNPKSGASLFKTVL